LNRLSRKEKAQGHKAQGMVEFALILPLLLFLLFGIIELGRMFLIYVSVSAASREAARYASAAGESQTPNKDYYQDCSGIREAAKRIGFFAGLQDDSIYIAYDSGPGTPFFSNACSPTSTPPSVCFDGVYPSSPPAGDVLLGSRVQVCVTSQFQPLLGLVPLQPFSMQSTTARTVIKSLAINEAPPTGTSPVVTIPWPPNKSKFAEGDDVNLTGLAIDAEDGDISNHIEWISDRDGILAQGSASFDINSLSPGTHVITAQVVDSSGRIGSKTITITIVAGSSAPEVTISCTITPPVYEGQLVACTATAIDVEDGDISDDIEWLSSRDGVLGTGPGLSIDTLSVGRHTIRAWVVDSDGLMGFAEVNVEILPNTPPEVYIDWPYSGYRAVALVDMIEFAGHVVDAQDDDGVLTDNLVWWTDFPFSHEIGYGAGFMLNNLPVGTHIITARVTDSGGLTGEASIVLIIEDNIPPAVQIIAPPNGWIFAYTYPIRFRGSAVDSIDGDISNKLTWETDQPKVLEFGSGESFSYAGLVTGTHTIKAWVMDSHFNYAQDTVEIMIIEGTPPTVTITAPADGSLHNEGEAVTFTGSAVDEEDGDLSDELQWESDVDGPIGSGATFDISTLTPGEHIITAYVFDSESLSGIATITVVINDAPEVTILTPPDASTFKFDDLINFSGSATDVEDGDLSASIEWISDIDGSLGSGSSLNKSGLTAGTHVITAQVTDSNGAIGSASVTIVVNPNPCVIEKLGYTVDQSAKTIIWNLRNNNTQASYTLLRLTIPWEQNPAGTQSLLSVTFGGSLLWSGVDTSAGTRFGPDAASEVIWTIGGGHTFEQPVLPATYVDEDLVFIFSDPANYINKLTIAVFENDLTHDICNVMISFMP
ncbi:MAG: pilus assembly protein, partial [Anaerolineales bacterium]|nr:pilus assembly protein [Anaerolineales bacterium]